MEFIRTEKGISQTPKWCPCNLLGTAKIRAGCVRYQSIVIYAASALVASGLALFPLKGQGAQNDTGNPWGDCAVWIMADTENSIHTQGREDYAKKVLLHYDAILKKKGRAEAERWWWQKRIFPSKNEQSLTDLYWYKLHERVGHLAFKEYQRISRKILERYFNLFYSQEEIDELWDYRTSHGRKYLEHMRQNKPYTEISKKGIHNKRSEINKFCNRIYTSAPGVEYLENLVN